MTIYLDWGEAEFWQHYESVNESVIATGDAAVRSGGRIKSCVSAVLIEQWPDRDCLRFAATRCAAAAD